MLRQVFEQSTDGVFGIDPSGRIHYWNPVCERLLGRGPDEVLGERCAGLLCGTDLMGQRVCGSRCPVPKEAGKEPGVKDFDLVVDDGRGGSLWLNVGAYYVPPELRDKAGEVSVFFSLRPVSCQRLLQRLVRETHERKAPPRPSNGLTARETEILRLAAEGLGTAEIARRLSISTATVRNHFKNIFGRLEVHSRVEAVSYALQHDLI